MGWVGDAENGCGEDSCQDFEFHSGQVFGSVVWGFQIRRGWWGGSRAISIFSFSLRASVSDFVFFSVASTLDKVIFLLCRFNGPIKILTRTTEGGYPDPTR